VSVSAQLPEIHEFKVAGPVVLLITYLRLCYLTHVEERLSGGVESMINVRAEAGQLNVDDNFARLPSISALPFGLVFTMVVDRQDQLSNGCHRSSRTTISYPFANALTTSILPLGLPTPGPSIRAWVELGPSSQYGVWKSVSTLIYLVF
jgi:hypothetical protein